MEGWNSYHRSTFSRDKHCCFHKVSGPPSTCVGAFVMVAVKSRHPAITLPQDPHRSLPELEAHGVWFKHASYLWGIRVYVTKRGFSSACFQNLLPGRSVCFFCHALC